MFQEIYGYFSGTEELTTDISGEPVSASVKMAVAVVLVAAANISEGVSDVEAEKVLSFIHTDLGLSRDKAKDLARGASAQAAHPNLRRFVEIINASFSAEQRIHLLASAWVIFNADNKVDTLENDFAVYLRRLLDLSLEQAILARKKAEGITPDGFKEFVESEIPKFVNVLAKDKR